MEAHLGHDFSRVRVHRRPGAEGGNVAGARAFMTGENIFLSGSRSLQGAEQQRLLAHELAHVVQQSGARRGSA
jgi:hypothetical protein